MRKGLFLFQFFFILLTISCEEDRQEPPNFSSKIEIANAAATEISYRNATLHGALGNTFDALISSYGHCWDTIPEPNLSKAFRNYGSSKVGKEFETKINKLQPSTQYYFRSYFIFGDDTIFSESKQFKTKEVGIPEFQSTSFLKLSINSFRFSAEILSANDDSLVGVGICWSMEPEPTIEDSARNSEQVSESFKISIEDLKVSTTYYLRAFARNTRNIGYSDQMEFSIGSGLSEVSTKQISEITVSSAESGGTVLDDGGFPVTSRGVVWSTTSGPTVEDNSGITTDGTGTGSFTSLLTDLEPNTTYYVRAFASNKVGAEYGEEYSFTTKDGLPEVSSFQIIEITATSAESGGTVLDDGGFLVTSRGVVWSITSGPTVEDNSGITTDGTGTGSFTSLLTDLEPNTTYYVRAFASNKVGAEYGEEYSFTTKDGLPEVSSSQISEITATSAESGGTVLDDGGFPVTSRGVVWSTTSGPTVADNSGITTDGTGTGSFTSLLTDLEPNTVYYLRAYAVNSRGASHGGERAFTTSDEPLETVTDFEGNNYLTVQIGTQLWMAENLKSQYYSDGTKIPHVETIADWKSLDTTGKAYCWFNNSIANKEIYGGLYTWAAAMNGAASSSNMPSGVQGVCPSGWHLPSDEEWKILEIELGMSQEEANLTGWRGAEVGGKLKSSLTELWSDPNLGATNSSKFTALPAGSRNIDGTFDNEYTYARFWSTTQDDDIYSWIRFLYFDRSHVYRNIYQKFNGFSVRCIKN